MEITPEVIASHGLTPDEYQRIEQILGRAPNYTELGIFSVMWSEHCSYKSSRVHLRNFPTSGPRVVQGPGENAGVIDIGDGWVAAFKMESHNHPSFIEPYQGAATGVGGILRDIFTMGARPIACLDSLRFGELDAPRMKYLVDGVVRGLHRRFELGVRGLPLALLRVGELEVIGEHVAVWRGRSGLCGGRHGHRGQEGDEDEGSFHVVVSLPHLTIKIGKR